MWAVRSSWILTHLKMYVIFSRNFLFIFFFLCITFYNYPGRATAATHQRAWQQFWLPVGVNFQGHNSHCHRCHRLFWALIYSSKRVQYLPAMWVLMSLYNSERDLNASCIILDIWFHGFPAILLEAHYYTSFIQYYSTSTNIFIGKEGDVGFKKHENVKSSTKHIKIS